MTNVNPQPNYAQRVRPEAQETKRKPASSAKRLHEVPSAVMPALRKMIVGSFIAGRSCKQIAAEYCVTQALTLELVIRAEMEARRAERENAYQPVRLRVA